MITTVIHKDNTDIVLTLIYIGAFMRWLFKGCKTNLRDELDGLGKPTWGFSIDCENFVIGLVVDIIILFIIFRFVLQI